MVGLVALLASLSHVGSVYAATQNDSFAFTVTLDWTNAYYFRGILQENQGVILQPAAKLTYTLAKTDDSQLDVFAGTWNSIQSRGTNAMTSNDTFEDWYECDLLGGLNYTVGKWTFVASYIAYTSPSAAFDTVQELDLSAGFDDSSALGNFALHPYALIGIELNPDGADGKNGRRGTYLELGISPGVDLHFGDWTVPLKFPVIVGLSLDDYYEDASGQSDTFGYVQAGVKTSIPLSSGTDGGRWTLNASVYGLFLGDNTAAFNSGNDAEAIGSIGLQFDF